MIDRDIGPWQTEKNQFGGKRKFRMNHGIKEYEMTVYTNNGVFTESEIEAGLNRVKTHPLPRVEEHDYCPLKGGVTLCRKDCSFWSESGCLEQEETQGRRCPLTHRACDDSCKLYDDGCCILIRKVRKA